LKEETPDRSHCDTACAEEGTQRPSLPRTPSRLQRCPSAVLPIGTRALPCPTALGRRPRHCRHCTNPTPVRFTRLRALPPNTLTSSYYCLHSNKHARRKPNSLGHNFSGAAFGWSSFLTFVSRRSLPLRSAPPVNPACAALRGAYLKTAPCSLPRPSAPLRSGD
jgi:hypothetical protein